MGLVGRIEEQRELRRYCESRRSEFVVVYGRRRVGKTFLVREYFGNRFAFYATGIAGASTAAQLRAFSLALDSQRGEPGTRPADWFDAFEQLKLLLQREQVPRDYLGGKRVVFIDELPWLDTPRSNFKAALELFWNGWASAQPDILLIVCGSATSWIVKNLLEERGGLHNRITGRLHLKPFTLGECERYFSLNGMAMSRLQMVETYMVFGGIPFYLDLMDRRLSPAQNVDYLCFARDGALHNEFNELYRSLFKHADRHIKVVRALAKHPGGMSRAEVEKQSGVTGGGTLTDTLTELERCGFVRRYRDFSHKSKDALFQLVDPFTLFHLRFVENSDDEHYWTNHLLSGARRSWSGRAFELVCLLHVAQIQTALGISGLASTPCAWRSAASEPGAQIDLVLDRADGVVNLCEMKFCQAEFVIDKAYAGNLCNKLEAFARETGTRKALHLTMVTACGVARNQHGGIVQSEVDADALFA